MSNQEIIGTDSGDLLSSDDSIIQLAENAERRVAAIKKIKVLALAVTNPTDWIDEQGKPYLQVSGAEKVARLFNLSWRLDDAECEEHSDGHFTYTYKGYFSLAGKEIEVIGTRSSRDAFFSRSKGSDRDVSTISRGNVKKAAMTNTIGNGVSRLLGIRNMTWDELRAAGLGKDQSAQVDRSGTKVARTPKYGPEPDIPITECTTEHLGAYAESLNRSLTFEERVEIYPDDSPEDKRNKTKFNEGIEKKLKYKNVNEKLLSAIESELESRTAKEAVTEGDSAHVETDH